MTRFRTALIFSSLVLVAFPVLAKENRSGAGFGSTGGRWTLDLPGDPDYGFAGYTLFWKQGFDDRWGLLISYRGMKDNETLAPGDKYEYAQFGAHAVVLWRHGKRVRPMVKFGLVNTNMKITTSSTGTNSEDDTTVSAGGGLEAGSERVAFYADCDFTRVEVSGVDFDVANVTLGIIFKY